MHDFCYTLKDSLAVYCVIILMGFGTPSEHLVGPMPSAYGSICRSLPRLSCLDNAQADAQFQLWN